MPVPQPRLESPADPAPLDLTATACAKPAPVVDAAWTRRLVEGWVAGQVGTLDPAAQAALAARWPDWQARAAALIAEGLLAYVAVEMVAPDLAIAAASGDTHGADPENLTARLGAHLRDFVDYRDTVTALGQGLGPAAGAGPHAAGAHAHHGCGHDHPAPAGTSAATHGA